MMWTQTTLGTCTGSITDLGCMWRRRDNDTDVWESLFSSITQKTGRLIKTYRETDPINHQFSALPFPSVASGCALQVRISNPGSALNKHGNSDGSLHSQTLIYILVHGESWYLPCIIVEKIKKSRKKKKKNSTELQNPNVEAEVYNNNKKCAWEEKKKAPQLH